MHSMASTLSLSALFLLNILSNILVAAEDSDSYEDSYELSYDLHKTIQSHVHASSNSLQTLHDVNNNNYNNHENNDVISSEYKSIHKLSYLVCTDAYDCDDDDVDRVGIVYCMGYVSCYGVTSDPKYAYAYGFYAMKNASIESYLVGASGVLSVTEARVAATYLKAYGLFAAYYADISVKRAGNSNKLKGYFYGYYGGYKSSVSCEAGTKCTINCGSSYGCLEMAIYCYAGAKCFWDCRHGDPEDCPRVYIQLVAGSDPSVNTSAQAEEEDDDVISDADYQAMIDYTPASHIISGLSDDEIRAFYYKNEQKKQEEKVKDDAFVMNTIQEMGGVHAANARSLAETAEFVKKIGENQDNCKDVASKYIPNVLSSYWIQSGLVIIMGLLFGVLMSLFGQFAMNKINGSDKSYAYVPIQ